MNSEPLDLLPLWLLGVLATATLLLSMELGYRLGRWRHARIIDEKEQPVGAMVASILGLLALLLGFTFSLAANRFEAKRQTVLEEANAIGTTYLRARLLPEPQRSEITKLLREYAEVRVVSSSQQDLLESVRKSEAIQESLWTQTSEVAAAHSNSIIVGVFIQSLNELIDLHAKRVLVGIRSRIPAVLWIALCLLAALGMTAVGYQAAISGTRRSPAMAGLVVAFSLVLLLIADLDRSHEGFLRVSQQPILDVQQSMQAPAAPTK